MRRKLSIEWVNDRADGIVDRGLDGAERLQRLALIWTLTRFIE